MPRQETFALILISLTILATVIAAFRIRDLPKNDVEKISAYKKCENCDSEINLGQKINSVKGVSAKRSYEDLKAAVRDKQQPLKQKSSNFKFEFSHEDDDDDDDDDNDEIEIVTSTKALKEKSPQTASTINSTKIKIDFGKSHGVGIEEKDEDVSENPLPSSKNIFSYKSNPKSSSVLPVKDVKLSALHKSTNKDDENVSKKANVKDKISDPKKQKSHSTNGFKNFGEDDSDDDDNDDDDNDDDVDDDDDDEDDDDDKDYFLTSSSNIHILKTSSKLDIKSESKEKGNDYHDEDDDDDDDEPACKEKNKNNEKCKTKIGNKFVEPIRTHDSTNKKTDQKGTEQTSKVELMKMVKEDTKKDDKQTKTVDKHEPKIDSNIKNKRTDEKESVPTKDKKVENKDLEKNKIKRELNPPLKPKEPESKKIKNEQIDKKSLKKSDGKKPEEVKGHKSTEKNAQSEKKIKVSSETIHSEDIIARHDTYLKQVTDALQRRNLIQSEFEDFYAFFPTFAPNFSRIHNAECRRHGQILLRQLRGTKLWALNMLDATAKIPSGILQGNGIQLGDFDQCLGSHARVQLETGSIVRVQGKYCLARIELKAEHPELEVPVHLAQAKNLFRSRIDDPGHFVPRFSTLSWGVCVPSACYAEDVEVVLKDTVKHYQHTSGLLVRVKVEEQDCQFNDEDWWEKWLELPTILTLSLYALVCLLVFIATFKDFLGRKSNDDEAVHREEETEKEEEKLMSTEEDKSESTEEVEQQKAKKAEGFIEAFSLYRTVDKLFAPGTSDDISCIHGVRGIATVALLVAHKFLPVAVTPYTNRVKIAEIASSPLWSWCRAGWVYTDCFLLLSGALTAYRITADSNSSALKRLFTRYLRLTPALLAIVLFYAFVWDNIGTGPMWGTLITKNAEVCQEGWWWNLLYVQNYFGFEDMCAPQTHQLALDMQLSIVGGIVVWVLHAKPAVAQILLVNIHALTAYSRYTTARDHRLTMLAYHGVSVTQLYRTARLSYTSTFHRSTPYLIGISLGLLLQNPSSHGLIILTLGWVTSIALFGLVWWAGMDSGSPHYHYSNTFAAQYAALAPIASALAIAWLIYVVHSGNCDFMSRVLCWYPLVLISRLSYALYLCQFIVFLTNAAVVRSSTEFTVLGLVNIQEILNILLVSTLLTLTFITPMQSLNKIFTYSSKRSTEENTELKSAEDESVDVDIDGETKKEEEKEVFEILPRRHIIAHREVLEEIPEVEIEYESQRDKIEVLEEIIEEEEDEEATDRDFDNQLDEDLELEEDMEIIEEENEEGGEDFWTERDEERPRRSFRFDGDEADPEEWELTATSNGGSGAQHYRFRR